MTADFNAWIEAALGRSPRDPALFRRALTHASHGGADYQRLEFLGDRVLGLAMAAWLYELHGDEPEGYLSRRINTLVNRETCADVAREIGVRPFLRLGKQAREDGAGEGDNVLGDVTEALIGALYLEGGFDAAQAFIRRAWGPRIEQQGKAPKHPKSALQEWAAANNCKPPIYSLAHRAGPHHAPTFTVAVEIPGRDKAEGEGSSKHEAETAAAQALMKKLKR